MKKYTNMLNRLVVIVIFCTIIFNFHGTVDADKVYTFGIVPQFPPRKLTAIWTPVIDELSKITGLNFKISGSPNIPGFEKEFMAGLFDFVYMNPYHAMLAIKNRVYVPLVRDGGRMLYGILVVRKDNPITDVNSLAGKRIAFPAPNALGASLVMRADLTNKFNIRFEPVYTQTHSSVYLSVILGETEAGGGVMSTLMKQSEEIKGSLKILYETEKMFPHPITAHTRISPEIRIKVTEAILQLSKTAPGKGLLSKIPMLEPVPASNDDYLVLTGLGLESFFVKED